MTRLLLREGAAASILVGLAGAAGDRALVLVFRNCGSMQTPAAVTQFFDDVSRDRITGNLTACKRIPDGFRSWTDRLIRAERERVSRPSRSELMEELRAKNEELERYNAHLEEIVAERTAELQAANKKMKHDLDVASRYVRSLLPAPLHSVRRPTWAAIRSATTGSTRSTCACTFWT
jgi:hypothetical protein